MAAFIKSSKLLLLITINVIFFQDNFPDFTFNFTFLFTRILWGNAIDHWLDHSCIVWKGFFKNGGVLDNCDILCEYCCDIFNYSLIDWDHIFDVMRKWRSFYLIICWRSCKYWFLWRRDCVGKLKFRGSCWRCIRFWWIRFI